ncbi:FecR family protein [Alistipes sp. OttesenSCG-928-B03]|nr:FecR family protein [Alistipes sp. OttesenSCG-928-B03]
MNTTPELYDPISQLISRDILGTISESEKDELARWLEEDASHRALYDEICQRMAAAPENYSSARAWRRFSRNLRQDARKRKLRRAAGFAAAAAVVIAAVIFSTRNTSTDPEMMVTLNTPRDTHACIIAPDGGVTELAGGLETWVHAEEVVAASALPTEEGYAVIQVPRGSMLKAVIVDDIKVFLNSETTLRYQLHSEDGMRKMFIEGEAYFDIDKRLTVPLEVIAGDDLGIRVHGTSFNVRAYRDDREIVTTLVTGKVDVRGNGRIEQLEPSHQLVYDRTNESMRKEKVDTRLYVAWTDGKFCFRNETLDNIMANIGRWYDVDIAYSDDSLRNIRYTGDLERYEDLNTLLRMLERVTNIAITVDEGVKVHVAE